MVFLPAAPHEYVVKLVWALHLTELAQELLVETLVLLALNPIDFIVDLYLEIFVPDSLLVQLSNKCGHMLV